MDRKETGGDVQKQLLGYFAALGLDLERRNTGVGEYANRDGSTRRVRYGAKGQADIGGTLPDGRTIEVEAKATGELPTAEQFARIVKINQSNGVAFWCDRLEIAVDVMPDVLRGCQVVFTAIGTMLVVEPGEDIKQGPVPWEKVKKVRRRKAVKA